MAEYGCKSSLEIRRAFALGTDDEQRIQDAGGAAGAVMDAKVFNALPDPVCIIDLAGDIVASNDCFQSQIIRNHKGGYANILSDILHSDNKKLLSDVIESSILSGNHGPINLGPTKALTFTGENQCMEKLPAFLPSLFVYDAGWEYSHI
jgi:hypothetical protein